MRFVGVRELGGDAGGPESEIHGRSFARRRAEVESKTDPAEPVVQMPAQEAPWPASSSLGGYCCSPCIVVFIAERVAQHLSQCT